MEKRMDEENISCSICLDLLINPVTIPCGHSYCMNCIKSHFDEEDRKGIHSCPQCRKTFTTRHLHAYLENPSVHVSKCLTSSLLMCLSSL
uniref:RING-type domain-containing protein n=1 Tax=Maylandia zebra TaxID=106582 RepID=A0A3P9D585_9CICH